MGLKNGVKCGRCDRRYSVFRSRCPYCGASRTKGSKRVSNSENSIWTLIVGLLILFVLIAAVVVLLVTTLSADRNEKNNNKTPNKKTEENYEQGDGVTDVTDPDDPNLPGNETNPNVNPDDHDSTGNEGNQVNQAVDSVKMKCFGAELTKCSEEGADYDISMKVGEKLDIAYETTPVVEDADVKWESADQNIVMVLQSGQVTAVGRGSTTVSLTVNGATAVCLIRVT